MKYLLLLLLAIPAYAQLPEAPEPQPKPVHFFTFRSSWKEPALKTPKKFWVMYGIENAAMLGAWAVSNHQKETAGSELPAIAGVAALNFASLKLFSPSFTVPTTLYEVQHYLRAR